MNYKQIQGGATLWARQTVDSEIFYKKPAEWFKIWFYLVNRVAFKDDKKYKRGELFLKYEWICDATNTTKNQIDSFIRWAKSADMLTTQKTTRGMIVKIANYSKYQTLDNYYYNIKTDTENLVPSQSQNSRHRNDFKTETENAKTTNKHKGINEKEKFQTDTENTFEPKQNRNRTDTIQKNEKNEKNDNNILQTEVCEVVPELLKDKQKHIQIIGLYARAKKIEHDTIAQQQSFIKRNLRASKDLASYDVQKIASTMHWLINNVDFKWTLESVGKYIDEDLNNIKTKGKTYDLSNL